LPNAQERRVGYEDVALPILRLAGVDPSAYIISADFSYDSGYAAVRRLMDVEPRPTAIFASSDQQAIGGLRAAADLGLAVPGDLSIVGFDDIPLANLVMPRLTTVRQPVAKIGVLAMQLLLDLFSGAAAPRRRRHLLATSLQIRQSCVPPTHGGAAPIGQKHEAFLQPV
jgi:LacI family transcriptional regulator